MNGGDLNLTFNCAVSPSITLSNVLISDILIFELILIFTTYACNQTNVESVITPAVLSHSSIGTFKDTTIYHP